MIKRLFLALVLIAPFSASMADVVVIVNSQNSVSSMKKSELARLFLGKSTSFDNGSKAEVVNQISASASRASFDSDLLGKTTSQINAYWSKQMFSGSGTPPEELNGDLAVLQHVAANPNSIGYIEATAVNDAVKVVSIQ
jgi:ABC-type phosphate transport system substrate-binding protein